MNARPSSPGIKRPLTVAYTKTTSGVGYSIPTALSCPNFSSNRILFPWEYKRSSALFTHNKSAPGFSTTRMGSTPPAGGATISISRSTSPPCTRLKQYLLRWYSARPRRWRVKVFPIGGTGVLYVTCPAQKSFGGHWASS